MNTYRLITVLTAVGLLASAAKAQSYLKLRQDGRIYDVDVVVFARQLSQPDADDIQNKPLIKSDDVLVLNPWDGQQALLEYPTIPTPSDDSIPISNQAEPVNVLSNIILDTSMNHAIVNRLKVNPTYKPIYHQKWRQMPSSFRNPRYVEVSNLSDKNDQVLANSIDSFNASDQEEYKNISEFNLQKTFPDFSIDGQVAFSSQTYNHLHVKMNLFRVDSMGKQIIYQLSQQKRISLNQWQYFDHQQFGVLAKVTSVALQKEQ